MSSIDLDQLARPEALEELDFAAELEEWRGALAAEDADLGASLEPGDVVTELLQIGAYRSLYLRARINDASRQRFLAEAYGPGLDELARVLELTRNAEETDAELRARIHATARSVGTGTRARYELEARAASALITHAHAHEVGAAQVAVHLTFDPSADGTARSFGVAAAQTRLAGIWIRLLTDELVTVAEATESVYALTAHLHLEPGPDPAEVIQNATGAVTALVGGPLRGAGIPVPRSELAAALSVTGVVKVDLSSPAADLPSVADTYYQATPITITSEVAAWLL